MPASPPETPIEQFYNELQTVPRLISDLALSIAEAQLRMDQNYLNALITFGNIVNHLLSSASPPDARATEFLNLFKAIAPSRYQFTETIVEVRADLEMSSTKGIDVAVKAGFNTAVFAVAVNAAYTKRSAYDYRAAALIRTQLDAIPSNTDVLDKLLNAGMHYDAPLPSDAHSKELFELLKQLPQSLSSPPNPRP
jgi:hypothetical protein